MLEEAQTSSFTVSSRRSVSFHGITGGEDADKCGDVDAPHVLNA
jgi:hypothetical protein